MIRRQFKDMPQRIAALPVDARGFPVPKFVKWFDSGPDFRIMDDQHMVRCIRHKLCWICGEKLGSYQAFVIGPMCVINRVSSEPPSHRDCAHFAVLNCPFLAQPLAKRRERDLPQHVESPGMIPHNPGVSCLWLTRSYRIFPNGRGLLFQIGDPLEVDCYAQGRKASRAEIDAAIEKGFPLLMAAAEKDGHGQPAKMRIARREAERLIYQRVPG